MPLYDKSRPLAYLVFGCFLDMSPVEEQWERTRASRCASGRSAGRGSPRRRSAGPGGTAWSARCPAPGRREGQWERTRASLDWYPGGPEALKPAFYQFRQYKNLWGGPPLFPKVSGGHPGEGAEDPGKIVVIADAYRFIGKSATITTAKALCAQAFHRSRGQSVFLYQEQIELGVIPVRVRNIREK